MSGFIFGEVSVPTSNRPQWWQWLTVLSLDAPLVVMVWQALFAAVGGVTLRWPETVVVGASVWLAYAADRWFEAFVVPADTIVTPRHRFYARWRRPGAATWFAVLIGDIAIALTGLSPRELVAGILLLLPTIAYVVSHQFLHRRFPWRLPKELCVAALIAGGASVFVLAETAVPAALVIPLLFFATLCFANVSLISVWEAEIDRTQGQVSLAHQFSGADAFARVLPLALAGVAALLASPMASVSPVPLHCVAASGILLFGVDRFEPRLGWRAARVLADLVLLTPALPLWRGWHAL